MSLKLPAEVGAHFRNRRALLWLCQRYELNTDQVTHDLNEDPNELRARYRQDLNPLDSRIASINWEAIWSDSSRGLIVDAVNKEMDKIQDSGAVRRPVVLAADPADEGQLDTRELLPLYFPLGLLDSMDPEGRYTQRASFRRQSYRYNSLRRIEAYPNRLLVVLGATDPSDLQTVFDTISEFAPIGLSVLVVWPDSAPNLEVPAAFPVPIQVWKGSIEDFLDRLDTLKVPHVGLPTKRRIRVRDTVLALDENDLLGITDRFVLLYDDDLLAPNPRSVTRLVLEEFLKGNEDEWRGYAAGLVFKRRYSVPSDGGTTSLASHLCRELESLTGRDINNLTLTLPSQNGAGVTTLLRSTAFEVATAGFPVLIFRQDQTGFDIDVLAAFLNRLSQRADPDASNIPVLLVFDADHEFLNEVYHVAQTLSALGRTVIVLRAENSFVEGTQLVAGQDATSRFRVRGRSRHLPSLSSTITPSELNDLATHFQDVAHKYPLDIEAPNFDEWSHYQNAQTFTAPGGEVRPDSLFWVALHFFLFSRDEPVAGFDEWIQRVYTAIPQRRVQEATRRIAALSAFRLVMPLTPLLRSLGHGGGYDMGLIGALARLDDKSGLIAWDSRPKDLEDQALRFRHPLLAQRLLRYTDPSIADFPVEIIWPVIESLKGGRRADLWLGDSVAFQILRTERRGILASHVDEKLETFRKIPPQVSEYSKTILHHWARALYHQALINPDICEGDRCLQGAVEKLERAIALPVREERDEHPSHLYTTLGTIYFELYKRQASRENGSTQDTDWAKAARCFEKALDLIGDNYQALAAYGLRLVERARRDTDPIRASEQALKAMSYLDQAEEIAKQPGELSDGDRNFLRTQRYNVWQVIDPAQAEGAVETWIQDRLEIGYVIKARNAIRDLDIGQLSGAAALPPDTQVAIASAMALLNQCLAEMKGRPTWQSLYLLYRLHTADPKSRQAFSARLKLLDQLELTDFKWHIRLRFEHAVLCYQNERYAEGQRRFRDIRALLRQPDQPAIRLSDFWRRQDDPNKPRLTTLQVRRKDSDFRGYGFIEEMGQEVLFRPRHFEKPPRPGDYRPCHVRFETNGPIAVPTSFPVDATQ